ncbi:hypothetical protein AVHY2522_23410 [Acidovorax sp. SUPP2522]|uniref:hypothetical protein n=1 Tax=unclassified Acidovorax TaxID=2684926 RepID=UPI00234A96FB|nr:MULTISPECIES: hypothetical protein [unclassified Acidovorax]WCM86808.1 glycerate kinase [Acidovorax sp. NCPPB 3576]WCM96070.1 glycerate kinase [Acidovorax sp. GBBC 1281]GKS83634.1 hypothetical protein AVMA1855_05800 [Acidovorax sp. SUPP1855]GKT19692.1 hypothetical protein AVHY2522_23410 [Acidovorax sp. SUPP2522]
MSTMFCRKTSPERLKMSALYTKSCSQGGLPLLAEKQRNPLIVLKSTEYGTCHASR